MSFFAVLAGTIKTVAPALVSLFPLLVLPYLIAVLMPSWRLLLVYALLLGGYLGYVWVQDWIVTSSPNYHEGKGGAAVFGYAIVGSITLGFLAGLISRCASLALRALKYSLPARVFVNVSGLPLALAIVLAPQVGRNWEDRPVSEACSNSTFDIELAAAHLTIRAAPIFSVYLRRMPDETTI